MKLKPILLAGVLVTASAAVAFADPPGGGDCRGGHGERRERMIDMLDSDNDGKISKSEARAGGDARFDRMDENNDGVITPDEAEHMFRPQPDANGDGKITAEEMAAVGDAHFAKRDKDGNGVIEGDELKPPHRGRHGDEGGGE